MTLLLFIAAVLIVVLAWNWRFVNMMAGQSHMLKAPHFDTEAPEIPELEGKLRLLSFSKTNFFRHYEAIEAAQAMLDELAGENDWAVFHTENNMVFSEDILGRFDVIVLNNSSGKLYTPEQQDAFRAFVENGGAVVALHGAGGDPSYEWRWYVEELIPGAIRQSSDASTDSGSASSDRKHG